MDDWNERVMYIVGFSTVGLRIGYACTIIWYQDNFEGYIRYSLAMWESYLLVHVHLDPLSLGSDCNIFPSLKRARQFLAVS